MLKGDQTRLEYLDEVGRRGFTLLKAIDEERLGKVEESAKRQAFRADAEAATGMQRDQICFLAAEIFRLPESDLIRCMTRNLNSGRNLLLLGVVTKFIRRKPVAREVRI